MGIGGIIIHLSKQNMISIKDKVPKLSAASPQMQLDNASIHYIEDAETSFIRKPIESTKSATPVTVGHTSNNSDQDFDKPDTPF